jgi:hypothetical protein
MRWWESGEGGFEDNDYDEYLDAKVQIRVKSKDHWHQWYPAILQWGGCLLDVLWILSRGAHWSSLCGLGYSFSGTNLVLTDPHSSDY